MTDHIPTGGGPYVRMPRETFEELSVDGIPDDYEPEGGVDFGADEVTEPERDIDALTETLTDVETSDTLIVTAGPAEGLARDTWVVIGHERDVADFDHRINMVRPPRDDGWTRLYITGIGPADLDPWEVVSAPYHVPSKTSNMEDFAANGWIADVEVVNE